MSAARRRAPALDRTGPSIRLLAMKATLVLTLIGLDKPGLVKAISDAAARHGANWEASRMARLGGKFAGLLLVTLEPARVDALQRDLEALSELGLKVVVEQSSQVAPR